MPDIDDFDTGEGGGLDLSPRHVVARPARRAKLVPALVLVVVLAGVGFVLLRTLGDAALFFYNADQAIEQRSDLRDQRFRLQGTPFGRPISAEIDQDGRVDTAVVFPISFEGAIIDVVHVGAPAELFQPGVPVVLEGTWVEGFPDGIEPIADGAHDGWYFASTDMVVKHDNEYRNDNPERIDDAERSGFAPES